MISRKYIAVMGDNHRISQDTAGIIRELGVYSKVENSSKFQDNYDVIGIIYTDTKNNMSIDKPTITTNKELSQQEITTFIFDKCKASKNWIMEDYAKQLIVNTREKIGSGKVLLGLSGGVDSSVVAALLNKAVGNQLYCIFVDHGLMRKNEGEEIEEIFKNSGMNFVKVNAEDRFLDKLKGVSDPENKRKIIGEEFIRVFEEEAKKIGAVDYLAQGTIYADIIESNSGDGEVIKSHHNVGGLPDNLEFKAIIEPLSNLFKEEVRELGRILELPEYLVSRQPFPGPGLGIRIIGDITKEKLSILKDADYIFRQELTKHGVDKELNQFFAVLTNIRSVGVTNNQRTYDYALILRAVKTTDFMSAIWAQIPYEVLEEISTKITTEVVGINRIAYDITSKPPSTIEWE